MKLTTESLRNLVKEVLDEDEDKLEEDGDVFPPPPDEQTVEEAEESLKHDQTIVRFYEGCGHEDHESEDKGDVAGLAARAFAALHDLATAAGAEISTTVSADEDPDEEEHSSELDAIVREEVLKIFK